MVWILVLAAATTPTIEQYDAYAWSQMDVPPPELSDPVVMKKKNSGVSIQGGGTRAHVIGLGFIRGLQEAQVLDQVRYLTGISGAGWAVSAFTFAKAESDSVRFGPVYAAEDITPERLEKVAGAFAPLLRQGDQAKRVMGEGALDLFRGWMPAVDGIIRRHLYDAGESISTEEMWKEFVYTNYIAPAGIERGAVMAMNASHAEDLKARNPWLADKPIVWPSEDRPFMLTGFTLLAPLDLTPLSATETRPYTNIDVTPLYAGQLHTAERTYTHCGVWKWFTNYTNTAKVMVGGLLETAALGGGAGRQSGGRATGPAPVEPFTLLDGAAATSMTPGAVFTEVTGLGSLLNSWVGEKIKYWSPASEVPKETDMYIGDGGIVENAPLVQLLQRKVRCITLLFPTAFALDPAWDASQFDAGNRETWLREDQVDDDFVSFFGVQTLSMLHKYGTLGRFVPQDRTMKARRIGMDRSNNQVFATADFAPVVQAMQAKIRSGDPVIISVNLTTVRNEWWGIEEGFQAKVTFVYLSKNEQWVKRLPSDTQAILQDSRNKWASTFPYAGTGTISMYNVPPAELNLLFQIGASFATESGYFAEHLAGDRCTDENAF